MGCKPGGQHTLDHGRAADRGWNYLVMTPPRADQGDMRMSEIEFQAMLTRAAEAGAKRALADAGIDGKDAALDIRDLRSLLDCIRFVRRTAVQTAVHLITTGVMLALLAIAKPERPATSVKLPGSWSAMR